MNRFDVRFPISRTASGASLDTGTAATSGRVTGSPPSTNSPRTAPVTTVSTTSLIVQSNEALTFRKSSSGKVIDA